MLFVLSVTKDPASEVSYDSVVTPVPVVTVYWLVVVSIVPPDTAESAVVGAFRPSRLKKREAVEGRGTLASVTPVCAVVLVPGRVDLLDDTE